MDHCDIKEISSRDLFPLILGAIEEGCKVKFTVSGNSMRPWIVHNRDQVLLAAADVRNLRIGDIILFTNMENRYILHRIYKKSDGGFYTMGDACLHNDGLVTSSQVKGVVETIYRKGREIECKSLWWRFFSGTWRRLIPFRRTLLRFCWYIGRLNLVIDKVTGHYD